MQLDWLKSSVDITPEGVLSQNRNHILHTATSHAVDERGLKLAVIDIAHKAAQLLSDNIEDDSLYLLFIWQRELAVLSAVVTDDRKANDAVHVVRGSLPETAAKDGLAGDTFSSSLSFWIRDYLTTSSEYMQYSLVAIFTESTRDQTNML